MNDLDYEVSEFLNWVKSTFILTTDQHTKKKEWALMSKSGQTYSFYSSQELIPMYKKRRNAKH